MRKSQGWGSKNQVSPKALDKFMIKKKRVGLEGHDHCSESLCWRVGAEKKIRKILGFRGGIKRSEILKQEGKPGPTAVMLGK